MEWGVFMVAFIGFLLGVFGLWFWFLVVNGGIELELEIWIVCKWILYRVYDDPYPAFSPSPGVIQ
ncbi:hypothetical protein [Sutcliffiella horikoshii]|uniref:hypothetical protein n=1 Tax=Sutcliffiella horikoshii TaxID=79883 RepID=UPI003CEF2C51